MYPFTLCAFYLTSLVSVHSALFLSYFSKMCTCLKGLKAGNISVSSSDGGFKCEATHLRFTCFLYVELKNNIIVLFLCEVAV